MQEFAPQAVMADDFVHFHVNMSCLLNMMRRSIAENGPLSEEGGLLAEQSFLGDGYELRLLCRQGGARPFVACMEKPWRHRVSLGRLDKDGDVRIFSYGLRLFYDFLAEQEVLHLFRKDLEKALDLHLLGRVRPETDHGCPLARSVPDGGKMQ
jgi:hypothetical protein